MQLDTTIEQRRREINNVSNDINGEKEQNENIKNELRMAQIDLLDKQIEKAKFTYQNQKMKNLAQRYDQVATEQFQAQPDIDAGALYDQAAQRNQIIEQVLDRCAQSNPNMQELLQKF